MKVDTMRDILQSAAEQAIRFLEGLDDRKVTPSAEAVARLKELDIPIPDNPVDPKKILQMLEAYGDPASMAMAGRRFFGFVIGGSLPVSLAANWVAGAWDQNAALYQVTPGAAHFEQVALSWLLDLFGFPPTCGGAFVTGATLANFTGLAAARHSVLQKTGWNVEADGLMGAPPITVIVGKEVHPSLTKSLGLARAGAHTCSGCTR